MASDEKAPQIEKVQSASLDAIPLDELAAIFKRGIADKFESVEVEVVDCPDLTAWGLAAPGLCGSTRLVDIGGEPFLFDPQKRHHRFAMDDVADKCELPKGYFFGPASSSKAQVGCNGELAVNDNCGTGVHKSVYAKVAYADDGSDSCSCHVNDTRELGVLANLTGCDGLPGKVVRVKATKWRDGLPADGGSRNFIGALRQELIQAAQSSSKHIGVGGVFRVQRGQIRAHVMPDFPDYELNPERCATWLKFYPMGPDLTCVSYLLTGDPTGGEMGLRLEHTHFFSDKPNEGGHYHYAVTPDEIAYEGFFVVAEKVYRLTNAFDEPCSY